MEGYGYAIRRDGKRWMVFKGWHLLASFATKAEANEYIEWHKTETKESSNHA